MSLIAKTSGICSWAHCVLLDPILEEDNNDDMVDDDGSDDDAKNNSDCDVYLDSCTLNFVENRFPLNYCVKQKAKCMYPYNVVDPFPTKT